MNKNIQIYVKTGQKSYVENLYKQFASTEEIPADEAPEDLEVKNGEYVVRIEYKHPNNYWDIADAVLSNEVDKAVFTDELRVQEVTEVDLIHHYKAVKPVFDALAEYSRGKTGCLHGHSRWYTTEVPTGQNWDWDEWREEHGVPERFDQLRSLNLLPDKYDCADAAKTRSTYGLLTYADEEWLSNSKFATPYDTESKDCFYGPPLPRYDNLSGFSLAVDLDMKGVFKTNPLPDEAKETIERRLKKWFDEFDAAFGEDSWMALNSGGGTYLMVPPAVIQDIVDEFDNEERGLILEELGKRFRMWCDEVGKRVNSEDDYHNELLSPDLITNRNRQYKAVGSVHSKLDAVVRPLDTDDLDYTHISVSDVDEELIEDFVAWNEKFVSDDFSSVLPNVIAELWDCAESEYLTVLETWVDAEKNKQIQYDIEDAAREEIDVEAARNQGITNDINEVLAAIDDISAFELTEKLAASTKSVVKGSEGQEMDFNPGSRWWRESESGTGAVVFDDKKILCKEMGEVFGVVDAVALYEDIATSVTQLPVTGKDWFNAVDALRDLGYKIPVLIPDITDENNKYERLPMWALQKAAYALNSVPEGHVFAEFENNEGDMYPNFSSSVLYNNTLRLLEEVGIEHGSEYRDTNDKHVIEVEGEPTGLPIPLGNVIDDSEDGVNTIGTFITRVMPKYVDYQEHISLKYDAEGYEVVVFAAPDGVMVTLVDENSIICWDSSFNVDEDIASSKQRLHHAGEMLDAVPECMQNSITRELFEDILQAVYADIRYELEEFDEPVMAGFLMEQTERVVWYPSQLGDSKYVIWMKQDPRMPQIGSRKIEVLPSDFENNNASWFRTKYRQYFGVPLDELTPFALSVATQFWNDQDEVMEVAEDEADYARQLLRDEAMSIVKQCTIYIDNDEGRRKFSANDPVGLYIEDFQCSNGTEQDVIIVGGRYFNSEIELPEEFSGSKVHALREEGILDDADKASSKRIKSRPNVWRFFADECGISKEDTVDNKDEDDENALKSAIGV